VSRKGCAAAPEFQQHHTERGLLRSPFATQGRSYKGLTLMLHELFSVYLKMLVLYSPFFVLSCSSA